MKFSSVLIVEDEDNLGNALVIALKQLHYQKTDWAHSLTDARARLATKNYDAVLLDRMLPDGEGLDLVAEIKSGSRHTRIVCMSARGEASDRLAGLRESVDDYLPKPFEFEELKLRLENLEKYFLPPAEPQWQIDPANLRVKSPQGWKKLTPLEFKFFRYLWERDGQLVTREDLLKSVWGFHFLPQTRTVDFFVGRLRKALEANPDHPEHILTVRGAGIQFQSLSQTKRGPPSRLR